jgi:hypothetical protein
VGVVDRKSKQTQDSQFFSKLRKVKKLRERRKNSTLGSFLLKLMKIQHILYIEKEVVTLLKDKRKPTC